jgi:tetratricopeptide (TPR) repeat protein
LEDYDLYLEKIDPRNVAAYINRGNTYSGLKRYERAIEDYNKAIELNPKYAGAYYNRGLAYRKLKRYERAIEDYNKAIELNHDFTLAYKSRGVAYRELKQYAKEQEDYKKALELDPKHILALLNFSESYIITKNYVGAHATAEKALNIAEESKDLIISHFLMVCSSLFQNKNGDARSQLNSLFSYLETIKDWTLEWDFSDIKQAIESSDVDEDTKSLMLSLIELLGNKITLDMFKSTFRSSIMFS